MAIESNLLEYTSSLFDGLICSLKNQIKVTTKPMKISAGNTETNCSMDTKGILSLLLKSAGIKRSFSIIKAKT